MALGRKIDNRRITGLFDKAQLLLSRLTRGRNTLVKLHKVEDIAEITRVTGPPQSLANTGSVVPNNGIKRVCHQTPRNKLRSFFSHRGRQPIPTSKTLALISKGL